MRGRFFLLLLMAGAAPGQAQAGELLIRNAQVYTLEEPPVLTATDIYIKDGRIAALGAGLSPDGAPKVIDATGKQVTPGLVNSYTHLGIVEIDLVAETADTATIDPQFSASYSVAPAFNPRSTLIPENRIHGVTHAVVAPESGHHVFAGQGFVMRLDHPDPMILSERAALFANYGGPPSELLAGGSRAAAYAKLRQSLLDAKEFDANRVAVREGRWREFVLPLHDLEALVPVVKGDRLFVVSVHRASDIQAILQLKKELGLDLVLAGTSEAWMVANDIASAGVPVIIDPMANLPGDFDRLGARLDAATRLHEAGVTLLFCGVDFMGTHSAFLVRQAAGNAAAHGLPPVEAIKAMTLNPARVFGFADQFGSIAPGKTADLVIWDGDPLELLTRAEAVVIDGEVIPMVSRSTRLLHRYRDLGDSRRLFYRR